MTYNTGNAVPSRDPRDLLDNAESLDIRVNSRTERSTPDRLGVERKTWHGMECDFAEDQIDRADRFDSFLAGSAYQPLGEYAAGIELTARNQVFLYAGEYYRAAAATALPYTLTGTWATDSAYLVGVGDAVLRQELAGESGGNIVGLPRLNGLSGRTVEDFAREKISINDFYIPGQSDWTSALQAARDYLAGFPGKPPVLEFEGGKVYEASVMPNWAIPNLVLRGNNATLRNTGAGDNLILDAGAGSERVFFIHVEGFFLEGGPASGHGVFVRSVHHSHIQAEVRGCGTDKHGLHVHFAVCTEFEVTVSVNRGAWYEGGKPLRGIVLDSRATLEAVTACIFINPIIEGVAAQGILLTNADVCKFIGGTSEANGGANVECSFESRFNVFDQIDLEVSGSGQGFIDRGRQNTWLNIYNDANCTITSTAVGCRIVGGAVDAISNSSATTDLDGVRYGLASGVISNIGGVIPRKRNVYNITTASFDPDNIADFKINNGATIKKHLSVTTATGAWSVPGSVPGISKKDSLSVPGVVAGDNVSVSTSSPLPEGYVLEAVVTAADTVGVRIYQLYGAAASPFPSGTTLRVDIWGH